VGVATCLHVIKKEQKLYSLPCDVGGQRVEGFLPESRPWFGAVFYPDRRSLAAEHCVRASTRRLRWAAQDSRARVEKRTVLRVEDGRGPSGDLSLLRQRMRRSLEASGAAFEW